MQIKQNFVIQLVSLHAFAEFWNFEELVDMEAIFDTTPFPLESKNETGLDKKNSEKEHRNGSYEQEGERVIKNRHDYSEPRRNPPRGGEF
ncbi:hypothetical protein J1N35_010805 [Gossypium stocksii]|uniref:Uncharacterized protein n=1 Tax=Gossypium stocksii TaxID=47602 RepID=A0A9D4AAW7_9ROSI|nr:hypothetical protein J1N35_010805 [Gossypium stocksii]